MDPTAAAVLAVVRDELLEVSKEGHPVLLTFPSPRLTDPLDVSMSALSTR